MQKAIAHWARPYLNFPLILWVSSHPDLVWLIQLLLYNSWNWEGHIAGIGDFGDVFLSQEWSSAPGYCKKYILRSSAFQRAIKKVSRPSGSHINSSLKLMYLDLTCLPLIRQLKDFWMSHYRFLQQRLVYWLIQHYKHPYLLNARCLSSKKGGLYQIYVNAHFSVWVF